MAAKHEAALDCAEAIEGYGREAALAFVTLLGHRVDGHRVVDGVLESPAAVTEAQRAVAGVVAGVAPGRRDLMDRTSSYEVVDEFGRLALAAPDLTAWVIDALRDFARGGRKGAHPGGALLRDLQASHTALAASCEIAEAAKAEGRRWIPWSADPRDRDGQMHHHLRAARKAAKRFADGAAAA